MPNKSSDAKSRPAETADKAPKAAKSAAKKPAAAAKKVVTPKATKPAAKAPKATKPAPKKTAATKKVAAPKAAKPAAKKTDAKKTAASKVSKSVSKSSEQLEKIFGLGRRKEAVARVILTEGSGQIKVNNKYDVTEYFGENSRWLKRVLEPLDLVGGRHLFDIRINLGKGGISGQADACRLAISRALVKYESAHEGSTNVPAQTESVGEQTDEKIRQKVGIISLLDQTESLGQETVSTDQEITLRVWHKVLKKNNLLTRDPRAVLRKLVGLVKARKAKQFSKR